MKRKSTWTKLALSGILSLVLVATFGISAMAADTTDTGTGTVTGSIAINGSITALTISMTHPLTADYAFDPNAGTNGTFTAPDITVKNNTKVPVNVTVSSLKATSGGSITFTDVDPSAKTWPSLNTSDSKKYIALGIKAKNSDGWTAGYSTATHYASDPAASWVGSLPSGSFGTFTLTANFGLAFDTVCTAKHALVFVFQLV